MLTGKNGRDPSQNIVMKELILLPSPEYDEVPRFGRKRKLQDLGLIIDGFPFDKTWDEHQLRLKVNNNKTTTFVFVLAFFSTGPTYSILSFLVLSARVFFLDRPSFLSSQTQILLDLYYKAGQVWANSWRFGLG